MIAAVESDELLHVCKWVGRVRLHVEIEAYCGLRIDDASQGTFQVPDAVFLRGVSFTVSPGKTLKPCPRCRIASQAAVT